MAKAKEKEVKSDLQIKDLPYEKRMELFNKELETFMKKESEIYGITLGVEIMWSPRGAAPRIVLLDLLAKKDEQKAE